MDKKLLIFFIVIGIISIVGFFVFINYRNNNNDFYMDIKDTILNKSVLDLEKAQANNSFHLVKQDKWKVIKTTDSDFDIKIDNEKDKNSKICLVLKDGKDTSKYSDKNLYGKDDKLISKVKKEKDKDNKYSYCYTCPKGYCKLGEQSTIIEWIETNLEVRDLNDNLVAEYQKVDNTDICLIECYTVFKATLYTTAPIFQSYDFVNLNNYDTEVSYKVSILKNKWKLKGIDNYTRNCHKEFLNGTNQEVCELNNIPYYINETYGEYETYNNEIVSPGEYYIRVDGKKKPTQSIDLSVSAFDIPSSEFRNYWTWWNSSFSKKKEIQIKEMTGVYQSNYQVKLNIAYDADMQSDWDDIRFTNGSENTELYYDIWNSTSDYAIVYVRTNLTAGANYTMYMYYGSASVVNQSNCTLTYFECINFESDTLDTSGGWIDYQANSMYGKVGADLGKAYDGTQMFWTNDTKSTAASNWYKKLSVNNYTTGKVMLSYVANLTSTTQNGTLQLYSTNITNPATGTRTVVYNAIGSSTSRNFIEIQWNETDRYRVYNLNSGGYTGFMSFEGAGDVGEIFLGSGSTVVTKIYWDRIVIGNWTYPEPIYTIGAEQSTNTAPQLYISEPINNSNYTMRTDVIFWVYNATDDQGLLNLTSYIMNTTVTIRLFGSINTTSNQLNISHEIGGGLDDGRWWFWANATDINNEVNHSDNITFFVDSSTPEFTGIPNNATIYYNYNLSVNFTIVDTNQTTGIVGIGINQINVNDSRFIINSTGGLKNNTKIGVGIYIINITVNDTLNNQNWLIYQVNVTENNESCNVLFNETSPVAYPNRIRVYSNCTSSFELLEDGLLIINNSERDLGAGIYTYSVARLDNYNYTYTTDIQTFTIDKGISNLSISGTTPITYPTMTDVLGLGCPSQSICSFNMSNNIYSAGVHQFNYSTIGSSNYSANWTTLDINVSSNISSCSLIFNSTSITYPSSFLITTNCTTDYMIYRNGTQISNNSIQSLGVSTYNFSLYRNDTFNYTNIFYQQDIIINKGTSIVNTYLNNSRSNITLFSSDPIYLNGSKVTGEGNIYLYNNGTLINYGNINISNLTSFINIGLYNISTIYPETQNYTESIETFYVNNTDVIPPTWDNLRNLTGYINTAFSDIITASDISGINQYWLNDTTKFNVSFTGNIYNISSMDTLKIYYLRIYANDTFGNIVDGNFSITISLPVTSSVSTTTECRYNKFGYYNLNLPFFKESSCRTKLDSFGYG